MTVRSTLWLGVSLCYPTLVVYVVGTILLPVDPKNLLLDGISQRLDMALTALRKAQGQEVPPRSTSRDLLDRATQGSVQFLKLLAMAEKEDPRWKARHNELAAAITASEQVGAAAAVLQMVTGRDLSEEDRQRCRALRAEVRRLKQTIRRQQQLLTNQPIAPETQAESARLRELQLAVATMRDSLARSPFSALPSPPKKKPTLFKPDTFTNPDYSHFALKVTLAAMTCYVLYTGFDWDGTRTAFVTCCFIALETAGATMHKGTLRITGCLLGALTGFLSLLYLVPHMTGITSLLLLSAFGAALGGWLAAGSERTAYAGVQFGYAFFICIDQSYSPKVDFDPIRDRIIGILLGLTVSTLVYQYIWPDRATDKLRTTFAKALRSISRLLALSPRDAKSRPSRELYDSVINDLGTTQQLLDFALFEPQDEHTAALLSSGRPRAVVRHAQAVCLIAGELLGQTQTGDWQALGEKERTEGGAVRNEVALQLRQTADFVQNDKRGRLSNAIDRADVTATAHEHTAEEDRSRLLGRLQEECALMVANCRSRHAKPGGQHALKK